LSQWKWFCGRPARHPEPGTIRHIARVSGDRKAFVFRIPKRGRVATVFRPVYGLITSLASDAKKGKTP